MARDTISRAIASDEPPKYERPVRPSELRELEPRIRELLAAHPRMPATVVEERLAWSGSITWFRENVARLRPAYPLVDPADRIAYSAGEQA